MAKHLHKNLWIGCAKLGSKVCARQSINCPNQNFVHNVHIQFTLTDLLHCLLLLQLGLCQDNPVEILNELEYPHKFYWRHHKSPNNDVRYEEDSIIR